MLIAALVMAVIGLAARRAAALRAVGESSFLRRRFRRLTRRRAALVVGLVVLLALAGLGGWLGFRVYESRQANEQRELPLQVARHGAINLTTIDFTEVDTDIQRIPSSAAGTFHDDFSKRSQLFGDVHDHQM